MAWQTPKTNWTAADGVTDADMNRIEGNIQLLRTADGILLIDTEGHFVADNVEAALHELYTNTVNGKTAIASAITSMGQEASGGDSYDTLANKIRAISTDANAAVGDVLTGKTFYQGGAKRTGTMPNRGAVIITPGTANQAIAAGYHNGSGYVKGDANLVAGNIKKGVSIFGVSGSVKPGWVLFAASGLYNNYNWGSFVAGYANGTPSSQRISNNAISLSTGSSCGDVAMVTNDPIDLTGIDYVCAVIHPDSYGAQSTYLIADTNKVAPYSTYVARVSGASDAGSLIQGLVLNVSSLSGLYYIRLHLAATSHYIYCYLVSLG